MSVIVSVQIPGRDKRYESYLRTTARSAKPKTLHAALDAILADPDKHKIVYAVPDAAGTNSQRGKRAWNNRRATAEREAKEPILA